MVLLGEPGRVTGDDFLPWISERGWKLEVASEQIATREKPVRILRVTLTGAPTLAQSRP